MTRRRVGVRRNRRAAADRATHNPAMPRLRATAQSPATPAVPRLWQPLQTSSYTCGPLRVPTCSAGPANGAERASRCKRPSCTRNQIEPSCATLMSRTRPSSSCNNSCSDTTRGIVPGSLSTASLLTARPRSAPTSRCPCHFGNMAPL